MAFVDIYSTDKKYKTILIDPPWKETGGGKIKRGADRHYPLMSVSEIAAVPVPELLDPDGCHVYLWVTNNFLTAGIKLLKEWGLDYITCITWMKDRFGLGQYYRGITEHCLFASTEKRLPYKMTDGKRAQGITGFYEPKREHSRKPEKMYELVEKVSYEPRIELFARHYRNGWDHWGNEPFSMDEWMNELAECIVSLKHKEEK